MMPVHYACESGAQADILEMLIEAKQSFGPGMGKYKHTPLGHAALGGHFETVHFLLTRIPKLKIDKGDRNNRTALYMASRNGHARVAALLLKYGADPNISDTSGNGALHMAAAYGWTQCVEILLKQGADSGAENLWKTTPMIVATQKYHLGITQQLFTAGGGSLQAKDDDGRTLLMLSLACISRQTTRFVKQVLDSDKLEINATDANKKTALHHLVDHLAKKQEKGGLFNDTELEKQLIVSLLEKGAKAAQRCNEGKTPLSIALTNGLNEVIELLGADINLNSDPSMFFAFGVKIFKKSLQELIVRAIKKNRLDADTINCVETNGFSPFLFMIRTVIESRAQL
jgi:ankyrin repeat protein